MSISIGSESLYNITSDSIKSSSKLNKLEQSLSNNPENSTDEELMNVCKTFESYLMEQVFKKMENTVPKSDEEGSEYVDYFKDMMVQQYAEDSTENQGLGIAQMLYESMKRNQ